MIADKLTRLGIQLERAKSVMQLLVDRLDHCEDVTALNAAEAALQLLGYADQLLCSASSEEARR